ncbi:hypothetical protein H0H92_002844 [Tricholoma furcatifolium]|nr:hypothetical protein H0H92_002844 [Tricholoma furcatifolium]
MPSTDASGATPHTCQACEVALQAGQCALHAAEQMVLHLTGLGDCPDNSFPATRQLIIDSVEKAFRKLASEAQVPLNPSDGRPDIAALVSAFAGTTISGGPVIEPAVGQLSMHNAGDATIPHEASDKLLDIPGPGNNHSPGTTGIIASGHEIHSDESEPIPSSAQPLPSSAAATNPEPEVAAEQAPTEHVPPEQRWYAVFVGHQPGVYQGYHNVAHNVQGIPNSSQQQCVSERSAWEAFKQALDADRVVRVTVSVEETRLTPQDFNL